MTLYQRQLQWLQYLQGLDPRAIQTAYNANQGGIYRPSAWAPVGEHKKIDYRTVLRNEVVIDIDSKEWKVVKEQADKVLETLHILGAPYILVLSGGKGVHIHIFFSAKGFDPKKMEKAKKLGLQYRDLRLWLWNHILDQTGVLRERRGPGKLFDTACVSWTDLRSGHLVRTLGGEKPIQEDGKWSFRFKNLVDEVPAKRSRWPTEEEIKFPEKIDVYEIPVSLLNPFLDSFIAERTERPGLEPVTNYPGKHLQLSCIQKLRQGLQEGQRNLGCQLLAIACACDGLDEKVALDIINDYSKRLGTPLNQTEITGWLRWALERTTNAYWHCGQPKGLGLCTEKQELECKLQEAQHEEELALARSPALMDLIEGALDDTIVGEEESRTTLLLNVSSVWLPDDEKVHSEVTGEPSGGKTLVTKGVLGLMPDGRVLDFSRITGAAFDYTDLDFHGKIIFIGEGAGANAAIESIKMHTDNLSGGTKVLCTIKDKETGRMTTEMRESKGHPVIVTTSAKIIEDVEFINRLVTIGIDTSEDQTRRIIRRQSERARVWGAGKTALSTRRTRIRKVLALLKPVEVVIPYAEELEGLFSTGQVRTRRDFQKFLGMIRGCAAIHQFQRNTVEDGEGHQAIVATEKDAEIVYKYAWENVRLTTAGLDKTTKDMLSGIREKADELGGEFTIADLRKKRVTFQAGETVRKKLGILEDHGYVERIDGEKGRANVYCLLGEKKAKEFHEPPNGNFDLNRLKVKVEEFLQNGGKDHLQFLKSDKRTLTVGPPNDLAKHQAPLDFRLEEEVVEPRENNPPIGQSEGNDLHVGGNGYVKAIFLKDTLEFTGYPDGKIYGPGKKGMICEIPEANFRAFLNRGVVEEAKERQAPSVGGKQ